MRILCFCSGTLWGFFSKFWKLLQCQIMHLTTISSTQIVVLYTQGWRLLFFNRHAELLIAACCTQLWNTIQVVCIRQAGLGDYAQLLRVKLVLPYVSSVSSTAMGMQNFSKFSTRLKYWYRIWVINGTVCIQQLCIDPGCIHASVTQPSGYSSKCCKLYLVY